MEKNPSTQKYLNEHMAPNSKTPFPLHFSHFPYLKSYFWKIWSKRGGTEGSLCPPYIVLNVIKLPDPIFDSLDILVVSVVDLGTGQNWPVPRTGFGKNVSEKSVRPFFLEKNLSAPLIYIYIF